MISEKMQEAINQQINKEMYSAYLYLSMSAYFETQNLSGFATWMKIQAQEEMSHAMKFYEYLTERMGKVTLMAIAAPPTSWASPLAIFEEVCQHEQAVTASIHNLYDLALSLKDHATTVFLQWFVKEQVEEEASAAKIHETLKMIGTSVGSLLRLDHDVAKAKSKEKAGEAD